MRENKFRVWCKSKNEWEKDDIAIYQNGTIRHYSKGLSMHVSPDTHIICFYTGLKDKNDIEIYEGYIVKFFGTGMRSDSAIGIVKFQEGRFVFEIGKYSYRDIAGWKNTEIIGNIYENLELIKTEV